MARRSAKKAQAARLEVPLAVEHYPAISAALDGPDGAPLRAELERILGHALKKRAPRRALKRIARLRSERYDEVVLLKDVSASGVRVLVQGDQPLDIRDMVRMQLTVKLPQGTRSFPVAVVRICGQEGDGQYIDLGCRFLATDADLGDMVGEIRSHVFGD